MNTLAPTPARPDDRIPHLRIRFAMPRDTRIGTWLLGTTAAEAVARVGLAYSICRHAQQAASRTALEAAGSTLDADTAVQRHHAVRREWLREHAANLMLAWPARLQESEEPALVRALMQAVDGQTERESAMAAILQREVLGMPPATFLALDTRELQTWLDRAPTPTARRLRRWRHGPAYPVETPVLPALAEWSTATAAVLASHMRDEPGFCLQPHWHGRPVEAGVWARQRGHPLLLAWRQLSASGPASRMLARLVELAQAAAGIFPLPVLRGWTLDAGTGLAAVETARGPLLHLARLHDGRVADYRVLAPTEWNFHPQGVLTQVASCVEPSRAEAAIAAWTLALDPCESCSVEVLDA